MKQFQVRGDLHWEPAIFVVFQPLGFVGAAATYEPPPVFRVIPEPHNNWAALIVRPDRYCELPANWYVLLI